MARSDVDVRQLFEARERRGSPRGFATVAGVARAAADEGVRVPTRRPAGLGRVAVAVVGLAVGVVAVLVAFSMTSEPFDVDVAGPVGGSSTTSAMVSTSSTAFQVGPCGPPPTRPANPTEEDREAFDASVEQSMAEAASGWIRFQGEDVVNGGWMCGWMRTPPKDPAEIIAAGNRQEVYAAIDGSLLGYAYVGIGFVPAAVADAPGFDPSTLGG